MIRKIIRRIKLIVLIQMFFVTNCIFAQPETFDVIRDCCLSPKLNVGQGQIKRVFTHAIIKGDMGGSSTAKMAGISGDALKIVLKNLGYKYADQVEQDCLVPFNTENGRLLIVLVTKNKNHAFVFREKARMINGDADESVVINLTKLYPRAVVGYTEDNVGFCSFITNQVDKHAEIGLFDEYSVVVKAYNQKKLGTALLALAIEMAYERGMKEVRIYNPQKSLFPSCKRLGFDFSELEDRHFLVFNLEKFSGSDNPEILKKLSVEVGVGVTDLRSFYSGRDGKEGAAGLRARDFSAEEALERMPLGVFRKVLPVQSVYFVEQAV